MEKIHRWELRLVNYRKALGKLGSALEFLNSNKNQEPLDLIKEGIIQRFEYTHELAWNMIADYARYQGIDQIKGSRDAARYAFQVGIIKNGEVWMEMIRSRNLTSHTYNEVLVNEIYNKIKSQYFSEFSQLERQMMEFLNR